jgi:hypothetical protein
MHENAVVPVETDDVGHRAERDEIEQGSKVGFGPVGGEPAPFAQFAAQGQHDIKHNADSRHALAREITARLVRIDDAVGVGEGFGRQVVVGNQRGNAEFAGTGHSFVAGDAVVDGDDEVRIPCGGKIHEFRRKAVAVNESIGNQIVDLCFRSSGQGTQGPYADGTGGGSVAVVVGHDQDARLCLQCVGQQDGGFGGAGQSVRRQQGLEVVVEFLLPEDSASCVDSRQQRVQSLLFELPLAARGNGSGFESGHR